MRQALTIIALAALATGHAAPHHAHRMRPTVARAHRAGSCPTAADIAQLSALQAGRRERCARLWRRLNPATFSPALADFFVDEHERQGIGDQWLFSLIYSMSGSSLNPRMVCRGGGMVAEGLCDTTESHLPREEALRRFGTTDRANSWVSIATHCRQAAGLHQATGRTGMDLMRCVFLPGSPDGARARREERRWARIWEELP